MTATVTAFDWKPVEEALAAFRVQYEGIDDLVEELFDELEKLRRELSQKAAEVERHRREADNRAHDLHHEREEHHRLVDQFEHQEQRLSEALTLLEQVKQGIEEAPAAAGIPLDAAQLQSEIERLSRERDALRAELDSARADAPHWSRLLSEIERLGGSLQDRVPGAESSGGDAAAIGRISLLEQERAGLVAELEQVRARGAELHEDLLRQQREHSEQNARLVEEIQQLRQLVERQAEMLISLQRDGLASADRADAPTPRGKDEPAAADPVVNSVMAQFAQLQKDVAKRRKRN